MNFSKPQTFFVMVYNGGPQIRTESWTATSFAEARIKLRRFISFVVPGLKVHLYWTSAGNAKKAMLDCAYLRGVPIAVSLPEISAAGKSSRNT